MIQPQMVQCLEKGIRIGYLYHFGLPFANSAFVMIWLEFDLLVLTIVQSKWYNAIMPIYILLRLWWSINQNLFVDFSQKNYFQYLSL